MSSRLHLVVLELTGRCNLSCSYCYRRNDPSFDMFDTSLLLDQLSEINPYFINISGGEPLLFDDLFNLAKELKKNCKKLLLTTNGLMIRNFPKQNYKIFNNIQMSLDGDKTLHERIRGRDTYEQIIEAAKYLNGITHVSFLCTISSENCSHIGEFARKTQESGVLPKIGRMCGFGHSSFSPISDPYSWMLILEKTAQHGIINDDPLNFWFDEKKKSSTNPNKIVGGCTAGIAGVAISPELDVYPCVKLRIPAGNLKEQSLKDIWLNSPLFASLRDWHNLKGHCPSCEYVSICRGCRADAWARTGDYLAPDPLCWLNGRGEE